jgi:hypothetical protein
MPLDRHTLPLVYFSFYYSLSLLAKEDVGRGNLFYRNRHEVLYEYHFSARFPSTGL